MKRVFITGVSSGIGAALASFYLEQGCEVFGLSRRTPWQLMEKPGFHFRTCDLSQPEQIDALFSGDFAMLRHDGVALAFLNAGISGEVPARGEAFSVSELQHVLSVNVLANKQLLDLLLTGGKKPEVCTLSASMAGVRYRGGTLPYSVSKAALAALAGVYAEENPEVFFAVLGLCNVNTSLSRQVSFSERTAAFPDLKALQERALGEGYMVSAARRAQDIAAVINDPEKYRIRSGIFADIRTILREAALPAVTPVSL